MDDLACMYKLLSRVSEGLKTMSDCVSQYLRELGKSLVLEQDINTDAINYIQVIKNLNALIYISNYNNINNSLLIIYGIFWKSIVMTFYRPGKFVIMKETSFEII